MKIVLFGLGKKYRTFTRELDYLLKSDSIVALMDNNAFAIGLCDGKKVISPDELGTVDYDFVLITSIYYLEMKTQLLQMGVQRQRIISIEDYKLIKKQGKLEKHFVTEISKNREAGKRVLLISSEFGINGATVAIENAALALQNRGWEVCLASGGDRYSEYLKHFSDIGLNVFFFESFPFIGGKDLDVVKHFDYVIVNVFQSIKYVYTFLNMKPILWWVHENPDRFGSNIYNNTRINYSDISEGKWMKAVRIDAVSRISKKALEYYYPNVVSGLLPYGLYDERRSNVKKTGKIVFNVVGALCERKGQEFFIKAAKRLEKKYHGRSEFWIVGGYDENDPFYKSILRDVGGDRAIRILGHKSRAEMLDIYEQTDISVCSSRGECLQVVTVEGMMHEKICITTDATGMTDYITDGENGLIFESENVDALYEKMKWCVEHYGDIEYETMRHKARATYEKYFTMEVFGRKLEEELELAKKKWEKNWKNER